MDYTDADVMVRLSRVEMNQPDLISVGPEATVLVCRHRFQHADGSPMAHKAGVSSGYCKLSGELDLSSPVVAYGRCVRLKGDSVFNPCPILGWN